MDAEPPFCVMSAQKFKKDRVMTAANIGRFRFDVARQIQVNPPISNLTRNHLLCDPEDCPFATPSPNRSHGRPIGVDRHLGARPTRSRSAPADNHREYRRPSSFQDLGDMLP